MKLILNKWRSLLAVALVATLIMSCNKDVEAPVPNPVPSVPTGSTVADIINTNPNYTLLKHAVTRANNAGINAALANRTGIYTVFAPDNAAFGRLGVTNTATIDALFSPAQLVAILNYHIIPGQAYRYSSTLIPSSFPNIQLPTNFLFPPPNTNPLVRFTVFPSKRSTASWVNNVPVSAADVPAANGVIHGVALPLFPPSRILLDTIRRDPDFTILDAAIKRADAGRDSTSARDTSFIYLLGNPTAAVATNFTVFAPTNTAFRNFISALTSGAIGTGEPDAVYIGFINTLPPINLRGILAYHVLAQRAFNVNFATTATNYFTFLNSSLPTHPGLSITATITNGFGAGLSVKGVGNATATSAVGTAAGFDRIAINGVFYKINEVLLPQ